MTRTEVRQELMGLLRESIAERSNPGRIQLMNVYHHLQGKVA